MPVLTIQLNKTKHQNYITGDDDASVAYNYLRDGAEDDAKAPAPDFYSNNYSDDITLCPKLIITYTVPITGVKTVNEVAIASVKTINDVLVENIKSVNNIT